MRSRVPASRVSTWLTALALAVAAWVSSSCREASEVQVLVQTNLPWDASKDMSVAIFFGPPGHVRPAPAAVTRDPWGADGHVGTLTAIPAGDSDAPLEMRVVMAIGRAPDTCTTKDAAGCIIERRRIRFIPHQSLRVPVTLWLECTNVGCTDDTTCNYLGRCVSSSLDENTCLTPAGCLLEGDPPYGASPPRAPDGGTVGEGGTPGGNPGAGNPGGDPGPGSATGAGVCVNGTVSAIATSGTKVFFGGDFTRVGRCVGSGVELSASTGAPVASGATLPKINGPVNTVVSDGMGGWFVGGGFDHIGATPRANLAHILASGAVDTAWRADTNGPVYALTTADRLLYVGGAYSTIGGAGRPYAAAVGFATGGLSPFNPVPDGIVNAIAVAGNYAYLGGTFMTVTGASKPWLAQVSATTGMISPAWTVPVDNFVSALATDGTTLFIGGAFSAVNTAARGKLAAVNLSDAALSTWNPGGIGITQIDTLAISGTTVYVGGVFLSIGTPSQQRRNAASITVDGLLTS